MLKVNPKRNLTKYYSPLRYPGGKTCLYSVFSEIISNHKCGNVTYIEPYAGGAGAALALLISGIVEKIVINDLDRAIYAFWHSLIYEPEKLISKLHKAPITIEEWRKQKSIYNNPNTSLFDIGFATFYLNRTNRSGILNGGPIGGMKQEGVWKIDARFNKKTLLKRIQTIIQYRNKISVQNRDGVDLIRDYLNHKNTFIYIDPPYYDKSSTLYLNHYHYEDHQKLANLLNQNNNSYWLLTYDDKKEIRTFYTERRIYNFSLHYNAYDNRQGKEVLIMSDAIIV